MSGVIYRKINSIKVDIHFKRVFDKEYDSINNYKVSTVENSIKLKKSVKTIKNINDLKYVKQNYNI